VKATYYAGLMDLAHANRATHYTGCLVRGETLALTGAPYSLSLAVLAIGACAGISPRETWSTRKPTARRKENQTEGRREKT
jgi:hypothetical protein